MTDFSDRATEIEEALRDAALKHRMAETIKPCGSCHYCGEPVAHGQLFCAATSLEYGCCRDDWEFERAAKTRRGE